MLKQKDKKIVLLVIFATAIVSLLTAIVASFVSNVMELARFFDVSYRIDPNSQWLWLYSFSLAFTLLCAGFAAVFFFNKKSQMLANFVCLGIVALTFIVFTVVLNTTTTAKISDANCDSIFTVPALTMLISAAFMVGAKCLIVWLNSKLEATSAENKENE